MAVARNIGVWGRAAAVAGFAALSVAMTGNAIAGTVFVSHDEWTLSNAGFANAPDTGQFVTNLVAEFGTTIHAYTSNFGFTQSSLAGAMASAGATYTTGTGFAFNLANISAYDAIFLGGSTLNAAELADLTTYVGNGGGVYIGGGTGTIGSAAAEAAAWNSFLAPFGVQMDPVYNGIAGTTPVAGDPIFSGVSSLYQNNGNGLSGASVFCCGTDGLYAINRMDPGQPVSVAPTLALMGVALVGLGLHSRRRAGDQAQQL
jgi:hypothetical protein